MKTRLLIALLFCSLHAHAETQTERKWREFHADPNRAMNVLPAKFDATGARMPPLYDSLFGLRQVFDNNYVTSKAETRKRHLPKAKTPHFFAGSVRRLDELLDMSEFRKKGIRPVTTLDAMAANRLEQAALAESPWSGSYWPIYQGGIGARYASENFQSSGRLWKSYYDFVSGPESLADVYASGDANKIDELSPSEKYDLLVAPPPPRGKIGGVSFVVWKEGEVYANSSGEVETWMGICHGWAPAAYSVPRPAHVIETKASDGRTLLRFYPADLKGLSSYIWAQDQVPSSFVGSRCQSKNPKKDRATGRILDEACFDTNPAVWHVSMVNQIGVAKRSFVMDATYDYEVWNQPVLSYSYEYFNPQTGKSAKTWNEAVVAKSDFSVDKFRDFRSAKADKFVGVNMTVTYVVESSAFHQEHDSAEADQTRSVTYMYDLELDSNDELIGGEWYNNHHPDFLWSPKYEAKPSLIQDDDVRSQGEWTPDQPLPDFWKRIAAITASQSGEPLPAIVEALVAASAR